jgi:hypothetical protein
MGLVRVDVLDVEAAQGAVALLEDMPVVGPSPIGKYTFVAR